jgi:hypothetical protein
LENAQEAVALLADAVEKGKNDPIKILTRTPVETEVS